MKIQPKTNEPDLSTLGPFKPIKTLSQFVKYIESVRQVLDDQKYYSDLLFRGQPCDEPLIPKLGRLKLKGQRVKKNKLVKFERLMIDEFNRYSPSLTEFNPADDWDTIALAQHHGLPTRLLDWSQSAYVALWFAVREPFQATTNSDKPQQGVVWIFTPDVPDYLPAAPKSSPFDNIAITKVFRPKMIAKRITAQGGFFTAHKIMNGERFVAMEKNRKYKNKLIKLTILPDDFARLRKDLDIFNVNNAALFPDLDGLTQHLKWRFTWLPDEQTKIPKKDATAPG